MELALIEFTKFQANLLNLEIKNLINTLESFRKILKIFRKRIKMFPKILDMFRGALKAFLKLLKRFPSL